MEAAPPSEKDRVRSFPDISPSAYEHPADRAALVALRQVKGFDLVLKRLFGSFSERRLRLLYLANAVRVGERQLPELHELLGEVCETLDLPERPELYLVSNPHVNAMAVGLDSPFVVVNSSLVSLLDRDELRCVLGHEAGHILSGHALYKTMLLLLEAMVHWVLRGPLILTALPVYLALKEWDRKSELSADRASLLVSQDVALVRRVQMKLAGGSGTEQYDLEEFERQAREYRESGGFVDRLFKVLNLLYMSHPFPVLRVSEIGRFAESDGYASILAGDYPRRGDPDADRDVAARVAEAAEHYREDFEDGHDPFGDLLRSVGDLGRGVWSAFSRRDSEPPGAPRSDE